jgi:hypothetical protein
LDIDSWLRGIGLDQYAEMFRANDIDIELLGRLTNDDLKDIGVVSFGNRKKLLEAIAELAGAVPVSPQPVLIEPKTPRCRADVAVWRRVSCWSHAAARWPVVAGARRRRRGADPRHRQHRPIATNKRSPPTNDRRRPPRGGRPLPHRAPHRRLAQLAHPAGRSRMPINAVV